MDLSLATEINRKRLLPVVAILFAMAGLAGGMVVSVLRRSTQLAILEMLRPAESAVRRLVAVLAKELSVTVPSKRAAPAGGIPSGKGARLPVFPLFDPRRTVDPKVRRTPGFGPNVRFLDCRDAMPPSKRKSGPDDWIGAERLCQRLLALRNALDNLPAQANRLARMLAGGRTKYRQVMRPGRPPGHRARKRFEVDEILADCHDLALYALHYPDTS